MSDNQKPSRDTGEEVCEVCGMPREDDIHDCGPYPLKGAHPYKPAQLSGDSGQSKPAPKAPVSTGAEQDCPDCNGGGYTNKASTELCGRCDGSGRVPKAPVSEDREGWLTEEQLEDWMRSIQHFDPALKVIYSKIHSMALAAIRVDRDFPCPHCDGKAGLVLACRNEACQIVSLVPSALKSKEKP